MPIKQVICVRKDLNMRRGKEAAQAAHASMKFIVDRLSSRYHLPSGGTQAVGIFSDTEMIWMDGFMTKITLQVSSEAELLAIYEKAQAARLTVHLIKDAGLTEFDVPTNTCLAIGPHEAQVIDPITQHLQLR